MGRWTGRVWFACSGACDGVAVVATSKLGMRRCYCAGDAQKKGAAWGLCAGSALREEG
jgi:hypothetical protein